MKLLLVLSYVVALSTASLPAPAQLVKLTAPDAVCIDGSPATYYISQGTNKNAFLFHLQGGGWCQTLGECAERAKGALGSSRGYAPQIDLRMIDRPPTAATGHDQFDRDPAINPLFHDWTYIYMPYCDGQSFAGNNVSSNPTLYFRGQSIRLAAVENLKATARLGAATDVVITGCSAGGTAAYLHTDWFAAQLPDAKTSGMPDSGWFLNGNYARDGKADYGSRMQNLFTMANVSASLPPACVAKLGYRCLFANYLMPFVRTPTFAVNSRFDASMAPGMYEGGSEAYTCEEYMKDINKCNASKMNAFGGLIENQMQSLLKPPHGAFLHSCYRHCGGTTDQLSIGSLTALQAFKVWYEGGDLPNKGFLNQAAPFPCSKCC